MLVRELIQKLLGMNMDATVIVDENLSSFFISKNCMHPAHDIHSESLFESKLEEVEQSDDLEYVRLW